MQRVSVVLELAVIIEWRRSFDLEGECVQQDEFHLSDIPAQ
jgi:hypothetical protein